MGIVDEIGIDREEIYGVHWSEWLRQMQIARNKARGASGLIDLGLAVLRCEDMDCFRINRTIRLAQYMNADGDLLCENCAMVRAAKRAIDKERS
jgi:hypothetical protein